MQPLITVPYHQDPVQALAAHIIQTHAAQLPDLSQVYVLLPDLQCSNRLRRLLLREAQKHSHNGLLGPQLTPLKQHVDSEVHLPQTILGGDARELVLVEALQEHAELFNNGNPWMLAKALLQLFDELTLYQCSLPNSLDHFINRLRKAYGGETSALGREAQLVHTLWLAWQEQLKANHQVDLHTAYLLKLNRHEQANQPGRHYYLAGYAELVPAEAAWLQQRLQNNQATVLLHGVAESESGAPGLPLSQLAQQLSLELTAQTAEPPYGQWLDSGFRQNAGQLAERARALAAQHPRSPASGRLHTLQAKRFEDEALAITLKVLQWKAQKRQRIGLVIEDRRLARRIRALLDRHGIALRDASGWALSTTSAAAALENWLQALEEDFAHQPLLDLLKSPFVQIELDYDEQLQQIYRLEQDIVRRENIGRNLQRYQNALRSRQHRLEDVRPIDISALLALLQRLQQAAEDMQRLMNSGQHAASYWLATLRASLEKLGLATGFNSDPAGEEILLVLRDLQQATAHSGLRIHWLDFRIWLAQALEKQTFNPPDPHQQYVDLLHLPQSQMGHFEGLIIGGVSGEFFPAIDGGGPFFNTAVRSELGLPTRSQQLNIQLHHFRRLLEAAPEILLTCHQGEEEALPSPWLSLLGAFQQLGWNVSLEDEELHRLLGLREEQLWPLHAELPAPAKQPRPTMPFEMYPEKLSATAHQRLIDCPYAFFAASGLKLQAPDEVREALQKSDYGHRVHRCLEAFHQGVAGLPGPWRNPFDKQHQAEAQTMLEDISCAVFAEDVADNFQHHGWLKRWLRVVPDYIQWQINRAREWRFSRGELRSQKDYSENLSLHGIIDRLDDSPHGMAVIDYKTGGFPGEDAMHLGEAVQLPHYAASLEAPVAQVEYLSLEKGKVKSHNVLAGEELQQLAEHSVARLREVSEQIKNGESLPAWGDERTCDYCQIKSICRREVWPEV